MRTTTKNLRAGLATGAICLALLAGCGANTSNATKHSKDSQTTTSAAAESGSTTSTPESTTTEAADTTTTTEPEATTNTEATTTSGGVQTKAGVGWATNATDYDGDPVGTTIRYQCPPGGTLGSVWGSGPYTSDSSVCTAAVHAGAITLDKGGSIVIKTGAGQASFEGSAAHGVTTADWGSFPHTFTIAKS